jgi:hypothetical protein
VALPTDKIVTLAVNREGILRQAQRALNKMAAAKSLSGTALKNMLTEAEGELSDGMGELKEATAPPPTGPTGAPSGPSGASGPTGPPGPAPFSILPSLASWKGQHFPSRSGAFTETEYKGRRAIKMDTVSTDGNPPGGVEQPKHRAQLETDAFIKPGDELWTRFRFALPPGATFPVPTHSWLNLAEIYSASGDGSPSWQAQANGSKLISNYCGGSPTWMSVDLASIVDGEWHTLIFGMEYASEGWVEQYLDGEEVIARTKAALINPGNPHGFAGNGRFIVQLYTGSADHLVGYFENETVFGRSLASVQ